MSDLRRETHRRSPTEVIADWWHDWLRSPGWASDLAACSEIEVDRMARDIGVSVGELQRLARRKPDDAGLLFSRMAALDLNPQEVAAVDRPTFLDLERVCTLCDCKGRCERDLAQHPDDADWEDYCPNVATLKMLDALPWSSRREW